MKVTRESWLILIIGALDLLTTLMWVWGHGAQEANPIFRYYLAMGPAWFIIAKFTCILCPILLLEFARRTSPRFAANGARVAIAGYLALYAVGVTRLNPEILTGGKRQPSAILGTMGPEWQGGRIAVAEHTFRLPMTVTEAYPVEGIR